MNKTLFKKVKDLCKDTGLSEKYLTAITEKMGGSIEDDSNKSKLRKIVKQPFKQLLTSMVFPNGEERVWLFLMKRIQMLIALV